MNIRDSDSLMAALGRRLQVDRIAMIDALAPAARSAEAPRQAPSIPIPTPTSTSISTSTPGQTSIPSNAAAAAEFVDRLPLGRVIAARVVDVPRADQVVAEVGDLRIEMAWPPGTTASPGDDIALRVLAHRPALLFERVAVEAGADTPAIDAAVDGETQPRWSGNALRLQARPDAASGSAARPTRFDTPILTTGVAASRIPGSPIDGAAPVAVVERATAAVDGTDVAASRRTNVGTPALPAAFVPPTADGRAATPTRLDLPIPMPRSGASQTPAFAVDTAAPGAVDGVVVARATRGDDGVDVGASRRSNDGTSAPPTALVPPTANGRDATPTRLDPPRPMSGGGAAPTFGSPVDAGPPDAGDGAVVARAAPSVAGVDIGASRRSNDGAAALPAAFVPPTANAPAAPPTRVDAPLLTTGIDALPTTGSALDTVTSNAVDGVGVARATSIVDGVDVGASRRSNDGTAALPPAFVPLILQGPAWLGQPMELIVHRERRDEALDDPMFDQWCGEVLIELPNLGRVAGHLAFSMQGLRLRLEGDDERSVSTMTAAAAELARALTAAELRVSAVSVGRPATAVAPTEG